MKATKQKWLERQEMINNLNYSIFSDPLLAALWDAVEQIKPVQASVRQLRQSLAQKYALMENGEVQTRQGLIQDITGDGEDPPEHVDVLLEDYLEVQTRQATILVEQEEDFREAMQEALGETVDLDVVTVPLWEALQGSELSMGELHGTVGWIIESRATSHATTKNPAEETAGT